MKTLFLTGYGLLVNVKNTRLVFKQGINDPFGKEKQETLELPATACPFDKVIIQGKGYVSTETLQILAENNINVVMLDQRGKLFGYFNQIRGSDPLIRQKQYDCFSKRKAYLAQSPQLYKEQLTLGLDRVFEIGPYFRAEDSHTVRHLTEFTSIDIEAAFMDYEDVMDVVEGVVKNVADAFREKHQADLQLAGEKETFISKIERLTYEQCLEELAKKGEKLMFGDDLSDAALRKLGEIHHGFYFIMDWLLKLKPFYIHEKDDDNRKMSKSFDLQHGYLELVSGGRRLHDPSKLRGRLAEQGLNPATFEEHLKAFDWGICLLTLDGDLAMTDS